MNDETETEADGSPPIPVRLVEAGALDDLLAGLPAAQAAWVRANGFKAALGSALRAGFKLVLAAPVEELVAAS